MDLTSKQRSQLKKLSQTIDCIVHIGKDGITENVVLSANDALLARELIKCSVQQNCPLSAKEACTQLCQKTNSAGVSVLGRKFVIYRTSDELKPEKRIVLEK